MDPKLGEAGLGIFFNRMRGLSGKESESCYVLQQAWTELKGASGGFRIQTRTKNTLLARSQIIDLQQKSFRHLCTQIGKLSVLDSEDIGINSQKAQARRSAS